jgi:hypothetical protein
MSFSNPINRDSRERFVTVGAGQTVFGPFDFKIYDVADVRLSSRLTADDQWSDLSGYTVALTGDAPSAFTVTKTGLATGAQLRIQGWRIHERSTDVTRQGVISSKAMEEELDKQAIVLQERARDAVAAYRALAIVETLQSVQLIPGQPLTPAQARTVLQVPSNAELAAFMARYGVTPFDFGALGQGADETSQLNAAINAVITGGGGTVWLPAPPSGAWRFNGRIQMFKSGDQTGYFKLAGVGDKARIEIAATTGDIFDFGSTSATLYAGLENLHVVHLNVRTSGIALRFRNNSKASVKGCVFDGLYSGIDTNTVNDLLFEDVDLNFPNQSNGRAINHQASVSPGATRSDVMVYKNVNVQCNNGGTDGMFIEGPVYGVTTEGLYMLGANNGLYISSPSNNPNEFPQYCRFSVFETDRAKDRSLYMLKARYFDFERCLFSNTSGATGDLYPQGNADNEAVRIESNVQDVNFDQTRIGFCRKQAAVIGGQRIRMLGCTFEDAAKDTPTDYALVYLPATARAVHLRDCFGDGANRARFALQYESAVTGKCVDFAWTGMKSGGAFSAGAAAGFVPAGQYQY